MREDLPSGTVTFLITDIEGSTKLLHELGAKRYAEALAEHRRIVRRALGSLGGVEVDAQGDEFFAAFPSAPAALDAAAAIADGLAPGPIRVRIGLHTGTALVTDEGYVGDDVHFAARIAAAGHGGQILVSDATAALALPRGSEPQGASLRDLGEHRLKDVGAVSIFQLGEESFPPLKTISNTNLPRPPSAFVGRERELEQVLARIAGGARLVTLTGPGGSGKTRLAIEAAGALVPDYEAGVFWVGLGALRDPGLVTGTIARALGARNGLADHIGERALLVLVDNLEQVIAAAGELSKLLSACPNLTLLATSRELLRVQGEVEFAVPPLAEPEAVALFCERAQLEPSEEIRELCVRLDALPLAVELAAARTKALTPGQILGRLSERLDLLRGGRDADPRQQTLRATIEWSYDLLSEQEQTLFRALSILPGGCTLEAAEQVSGADLDTLQSLVEKSLIRFSGGRYWMLETIRDYATGLLESEEGEALRGRLRAYFVALGEASAETLHGAGEAAASARLAPDYPNVRAAVAFALAAGEPDDVGRLLGALYPFLISHGNLAEGREWAESALAERERLSPRGLAETLVGGGEILRFAGDLDRAVELKEELASVEGDAPAAELEGGDAGRSLRDRPRSGRLRRRAPLRRAQQGGRRRGPRCARLCGAGAPTRRARRGRVAGARGARRPRRRLVQPRMHAGDPRRDRPPRRGPGARVRPVPRRPARVRCARRRRRHGRLPGRPRAPGGSRGRRHTRRASRGQRRDPARDAGPAANPRGRAPARGPRGGARGGAGPEPRRGR